MEKFITHALQSSLSTETSKRFHLIRVDCYVKPQSCYFIIKLICEMPNPINNCILIVKQKFDTHKFM